MVEEVVEPRDSRLPNFLFAGHRRSPRFRPRRLLLFWLDHYGDFRDHFRVQLDPHRMLAQRLDAAGEVDAAAVDREALSLERMGDLTGGDRAVERLGLPHSLADRDPRSGELAGRLRRRVALRVVPGVDLLAL